MIKFYPESPRTIHYAIVCDLVILMKNIVLDFAPYFAKNLRFCHKANYTLIFSYSNRTMVVPASWTKKRSKVAMKYIMRKH